MLNCARGSTKAKPPGATADFRRSQIHPDVSAREIRCQGLQTRTGAEIYFAAGMPKQSAGLLAYRTRDGELEIFLVHPGGPFWARKDAGAWSIPKGEFAPEETPLDAARREFTEETGVILPGPFVE